MPTEFDLSSLTINGGANGSAQISDSRIELSAGPDTDWFHHPAEEFRKANVISVARTIEIPAFSVIARVSVGFKSSYDAGAIFLKCDDENWAKIAFELSGAGKPTIVSVVTRGISDDSDGPVWLGESVWLRLSCDGETIAFHFSEDGKFWNFQRWFSLPGLAKRPLTIGFGAQSPTGDGCVASFEGIELRPGQITNLRDGS
ncbi:DUF1349 domain-containing protein [Paracoccus aminophilus]|uniref:DUF1349 domain-containing protein n=1 Tax=Paracoccus aminophilus JCM 7686 TaxID=1367847 RepID=S5XZM6_PARAH|nr:DUF1349 domain-containing protein [Paracoccus aminophilus]AGT08895.1 hypothetical protein JCM7686_1794 [Paracoccus aminophilus JCM 7686]